MIVKLFQLLTFHGGRVFKTDGLMYSANDWNCLNVSSIYTHLLDGHYVLIKLFNEERALSALLNVCKQS